MNVFCIPCEAAFSISLIATLSEKKKIPIKTINNLKENHHKSDFGRRNLVILIKKKRNKKTEANRKALSTKAKIPKLVRVCR